jgi:hypothetical protein
MRTDLDFIDSILSDTDNETQTSRRARISNNISEATEDDWNDFWNSVDD